MPRMIVDPPSGWKFGFPREFDFKPSQPKLPEETYEAELRQWFLDCGYPKKLIAVGALKHLRVWEED